MDPISVKTASGWLDLATSPYGGAFLMGAIIGGAVAIWAWNKFVVKPKIELHESDCERRMDEMQKELDEVKRVAQKWNNFIEQKAMEALGQHLPLTRKDDSTQT